MLLYSFFLFYNLNSYILLNSEILNQYYCKHLRVTFYFHHTENTVRLVGWEYHHLHFVEGIYKYHSIRMCLAESCEKANILIPKQQNNSYSVFLTYLEILQTSYQCYHCSKRHLKIDRINLGDFKNKSPSDAILQSSTISVKTVNSERPWNTDGTILSTVLPCFHHYLVWDVIPLNVLLVRNHKAQTEFMYQYPLVITCLQQIRLLHLEIPIKQKKIINIQKDVEQIEYF